MARRCLPSYPYLRPRPNQPTTDGDLHSTPTVQETTALEQEDDLVHDGADVLLLQVDNQIGLDGGLVRVVDTGEALDLAGAGLGVDTTAVGLLAVLERGGDVDEEEVAVLLDGLAGLAAGILEGGDGGGDDGGTGLGELGGDKGDAGDVEVAVLAGEAELLGQLVADGLTEEHGDRAATILVECDLEGTGDLVLARVLVSGEEDCETLLAGKGVLLAEDLDDLGVGEPGGDLLAGAKAVAQLGTGDVESTGALGDLVGGHVLVSVGDVDHLLELDHLDAELLLVLLDEVLSVVRTIVVLAVLVLTGTGVVTADDEVGGTVVLADDGVPEGLTGTAHAHSEGKESESTHAVGVTGQESLVDTDTGEVVNVTGLGQADNGVNEDVGLLRASGTDGQLTVSAVHGVASLEGDDLLPAELVEVSAELSGGEAQLQEIIVLQTLDSLELATNIEFLGDVEEVLDTGVSIIITAKNLDGLVGPSEGARDGGARVMSSLLVGSVDILDGEDGQVAVISQIAKGDLGARLDAEVVNLLLIHVQRDRHTEEGAIGKAESLDNARGN
ncbi:unnamed protein product [Clonostachys rosea]|uniref:NAD-specific glutamate dehydrogenase n=1 Tax=Bionectria ochroleuca TaxID=29856 RepID=A0ABY6V1J9_BIOOC|nr:unnamed protein product [Clonostachys rosea]